MVSTPDPQFRYTSADLTRVVQFVVRRALVLALLCGTVAAQSHALDAAHESHEAQHCCVLCHFGPLPLMQAAAPSAPAPLLAVAWVEPSPGLAPARDVQLATSSSRAPPA